MYKKVLLAYDGSVEGRRALREGAKLAQLCRSEVFLLAVVEVSSIMTPEAGLTIPIELQTEDYKAILNEGTERLKALGFSPTARLEVGDAGQKIAEVAEEKRREYYRENYVDPDSQLEIELFERMKRMNPEELDAEIARLETELA